MNLEARKFSGKCPLYVEKDGSLWVSRSYEVLRSQDNGRSFQKVAVFSPHLMHKLGSFFRLTSRFLRTGFYAIMPLKNGSLLGVVKSHIVICPKDETKFRVVFDIPRGSRPLNICVMPDGGIYFGEYFDNAYRDVVHIYGSFDHGETWEIVCTFPQGSIRHIHGIFYDVYRKGCWILTGDNDNECKIIFTKDNFETLKTVIAGGQKARAVSIIPLQEGLIVPTDTPSEPNKIQWLDPQTGILEKIFNLPGSAFYTGRAENYLLVSTVVEPSKVNSNQYAVLFLSEDNGRTWSELYRKKKDIWPLKYFQYGALKLPEGNNPQPVVYAYGQAVNEIDDHMLVMNLKDYYVESSL